MTRVLVTGASGFVGRWSIEPLRERGAEVHAVTGPAEAGHYEHEVHQVDLHDRGAVDALMRQVRPTHLLHFAWIATPGVYLTSLENPRWVQSSLQLVEAFLANGGQRIVLAGSAAEYDWSEGTCSERTTPCRPATLYAACKHAVFEVVERWSAQAGFGFAAGRLFWVYGPGEAPERLVPSMIRASDARTPMTLRHPKQVRDYMHVSDAGSAFAALLASDAQGAVNIASGEGVELGRLGQLVGDAVGNGLRLERSEESVADPSPIVVADVTRLQSDVAWTVRYRLEDGIRQTVAWWKAHDKMVQA
ncbi:MAG TPA: NAD(P)-dependent oxidoreductase [Vicinamibacterales bacterium]|nr:NAD(P)-dependent oxidoreductase [Vicinamibacterales bacterium]